MSQQIAIGELRKGNAPAFRKLVAIYSDRVYNTALGMVQNSGDAEDLSQEVFLEIFKSLPRFREESSLSTWIYRITVSKSLEHIRTAGRKKRSGLILSLFGKENLLTDTTEQPFYHPGIQLENKERAAILFSAMAKLPVNQRTAFTLHKVEGLSHPEIAAIMETSVPSIESLIFRARKKLQELLSDYYEKNEH